MKHYDYLIVGAGLFGAMFAYLATQNDKTCLVIEKNDYVGGACYDKKYNDEIIVQEYGPHIFRTNDKKLWKFVNSIVEFIPFINCPKALSKNKLYSLPFNMNTFKELWEVITPEQAKEKIKSQILNIDNPKNLEEKALSMVGKDIYNTLIKEYTEKQWMQKCSELPPEIINRLPLRYTYNNNYYNDIYQGLPKNGYTDFINKLLEKSDVRKNLTFDKSMLNLADKVIITSRIDSFFDYIYGKLKFRSLKFETYTEDISKSQGNPVINYIDKEYPYTRITEHNLFLPNDAKKIYKTKEYPIEWIDGKTEPYYPIRNEYNLDIFNKYKKLSEKYKNIYFAGRLGNYVYKSMDETINDAINLFNKIEGKNIL